MALGERTPVASSTPAAAARLAVGRSPDQPGLGAGRLARRGEAVGELDGGGGPPRRGRRALRRGPRGGRGAAARRSGIAIPVGKDSMSMRTVWNGGGKARGLAGVADRDRVRARLRRAQSRSRRSFGATSRTRALAGRPRRREAAPGRLGAGAGVLGGSAATAPDLDSPELLKGFVAALQRAQADGLDARLSRPLRRRPASPRRARWRSPAAWGVELDLGGVGGHPLAALFNEELGALLQVRERRGLRCASRRSSATGSARRYVPARRARLAADDRRCGSRAQGAEIYSRSRASPCAASGRRPRYRMQALRDNA